MAARQAAVEALESAPSALFLVGSILMLISNLVEIYGTSYMLSNLDSVDKVALGFSAFAADFIRFGGVIFIIVGFLGFTNRRIKNI